MMTSCSERKQAGRRDDGRGVARRSVETAVPRVRAADASPGFLARSRAAGDGTAVLVLTGELDLYRAPEIEERSRRRSDVDGGRPQRGTTPPHRRPPLGDVHRLDHAWAATRREPAAQARGAELNVLVGPQTPMTAFVVTGSTASSLSAGTTTAQTHDGPRHARNMRAGRFTQSSRIQGSTRRRSCEDDSGHGCN